KTSLQSSNQLKGGQQETPPAHKPETKQQSSPQLPQAPASNVQIESPGSQGRSDGASDPLPTQGVKPQNSDDGQNNPASNSGTPKNQPDIPSVQDKAQETNPTTPENTGQENAQRSDIADTGNKGDKLKASEPISQDKQGHQPSEHKDPPKESGSELKDKVKELDNTPIDTDTQDGSNPEPKTKQDKTDTGAGNTKDNPNIGENGEKGSDGVTANQITDSKSGIPKPGKTSLQSSNQLKGGQQETPPAHKPETKQQSSPQLPQAPASNVQIESPGSQGRSDGASDPLPTQGVKPQNSDDGQNNPASNSGTPKNQPDIPSVQDKAQETNPTTPENTGQENAQRSDIADTGNKGDKLKASEPISQDKQGHQPSEHKDPPKESGSELKDKVKELDNTPIDTDTQDGSNPEPKTKQDKTDTGAGNTKDNPNIGENGEKGSDGVTANQITDSKSGIPSSETGNGDSNEGGADLGTGGPGSETGGGKGSQVRDSGSGTGG
ncbi:hypothetical protein PCHDK_000502100, partial [Plasmodium chabaudi adami]